MEARTGQGPRKLFGTDGVRGVAGEFLTAELATALGRAAAAIAPVDAPQVLIVRDTPWRNAPAWADTPPPCMRAMTSMRDS